MKMIFICFEHPYFSFMSLVYENNAMDYVTTLGIILGKVKKKLNKTQAPHIFFFTLLVMLENSEPTCIVTMKMVTN